MTLRLLIATLALSPLLTLGCSSDDEALEGGGNRPEDAGDQTDENDGTDEEIVTLRDGGIDAGVIVLTCEGVPDGASCGSMGGLICLDDECVTSLCGDGFANDLMLEDCDDGNDVPGDGCEPDCKFSCTEIDECDDGNACNGNEVCDTADHVCVAGATAVDETPCMSAAVEDGECRSGICVPEGCGDMAVEGAEECDDGNQVAGDGCEPTCVYSCSEDADCDDNNVCNGVEACDTEQHVCTFGEGLECDAEDECHQGACDPIGGCSLILVDGDGDGYAPSTLACGDDCDDTRSDVNPGQVELCDDLDQNCDGEGQPKEAPTWYVDCDADGFAALGAEMVKGCDMPPVTACGGRWTTTVPSESQDPPTFDCYDLDPEVHPRQTGWFYKASGNGYDYDCDRAETPRWPQGKASAGDTCAVDRYGVCTGPSGWTDGVASCGDRAMYTECEGTGGAVEAGGGFPIPIEPCGIRACSCGRVTAYRIQECQ